MNAELCKKALEKVGNPNTLINLVWRRVCQLTAGSGDLSRPLVANVQNLGAGDIALMEIIQDKMGRELPGAPEPLKAPCANANAQRSPRRHPFGPWGFEAGALQGRFPGRHAPAGPGSSIPPRWSTSGTSTSATGTLAPSS